MNIDNSYNKVMKIIKNKKIKSYDLYPNWKKEVSRT